MNLLLDSSSVSSSCSHFDDTLPFIKPCKEDLYEHKYRPDSNKEKVPPAHFSWEDINAYVTENQNNKSSPTDVELSKSLKKKVLIDVFGSANPGEVLAIMGVSGAGKTSLLNILAQRNVGALEFNGTIKVNGQCVGRQHMKKISAYVQQNDCFVGSLTVEEHLLFHAKLRMGDQYSYSMQKIRVKQVMRDLGLKNSCNTIIGTKLRKGLSDGEKKRLAFASEILTSPPILLCDEPTSGLDSFLAYQVVTVLKTLAHNKGMTTVLTIHQPSSQVVSLFDRLYLMAEGRVAFCGTQSEAANFWTQIGSPLPYNFNPSDHYTSTLSIRDNKNKQQQKNTVMGICDKFEKSLLAQSLKCTIKSRISSCNSSINSGFWSDEEHRNMYCRKYNASWIEQVKSLWWRNTKTVLREPTLLKVQLCQTIISAVMIGLFYINNSISQQQVMNINGSIYRMINSMGFMFQFSVVTHFCLEMNTFQREESSGLYSVSAYFVAKNLSELPNYTLYAVIFCSIFYWMTAMVPIWSAFLFYVFVGIVIQNITSSMGYAVGCIFGNVTVAMTMINMFLVPLTAFGGYFINQGSLPLYFYPMKYISYFGYAYESLSVNEWSHIDNIPGCTYSIGSRCYRNGNDVIKNLSFKSENMWINVGIMLGMIVVIRFIAFIGLYARARLKK